MDSLNLINYNKWHKIASTHINEIENKYYNSIQENIEHTNSIIKNNDFSILTS